MKIILLGPPGAGKGTQAKSLAEKTKLAHISTGDLLRQNVAAGTELGKNAKRFMDMGALVPDDLVTRMLSERFQKPDIKNGFILDGYPRTLKQAESLDELLKVLKLDIDIVFYLDTSEAVVIQRLSGRLVCSKCGMNYHVINMPPKQSMVCDKCGSALYQRSDDAVETIKNRLQVYLKESAVLIDYYKKSQKLQRIPADDPAGVVLEKMLKLVGATNDTSKV